MSSTSSESLYTDKLRKWFAYLDAKNINFYGSAVLIEVRGHKYIVSDQYINIVDTTCIVISENKEDNTFLTYDELNNIDHILFPKITFEDTINKNNIPPISHNDIAVKLKLGRPGEIISITRVIYPISAGFTIETQTFRIV